MPINIETMEADKRLSESLIWNLQKETLKKGSISPIDEPKATTRASLANVYSEFICAFLLDYAERLDFMAPLYILELGAESGTFSAKVIASLKQKLNDFSRFKDLKICYLMSDWQANGFAALRQSSPFKEHIQSGELDFALIEDPEKPAIDLTVKGQSLSPADFKNPLLVLSRHYFEKTRQDAFNIRNHKAFLRPYTFFRDSNLYSRETPLAPQHLRSALGECTSDWQRYDDAHFEDVLAQYEEIFADASIIFPLAALRFVKSLTELTGKKLVMFIADKGHSEPGCFQFAGPSHKFQIHDHCITFDVNFDALRRYVGLLDGESMVYAGDKHNLVNAAYFVFNERMPLEHSHHFWRQVIKAKDPVNVSLIVEHLIHELVNRESSRFISDTEERFSLFLALLRTGDYEPSIFVHSYDSLLPKEGVEFAEFEPARRNDMVAALRRVFANIPYPQTELTALEKLSDMFLLMGSFDDCIEVSNLANDALGAQTHFFDRLAMAYRGKKEFKRAAEILQECRRQFPDHPWPLEEMERLETDRQKHEAQVS